MKTQALIKTLLSLGLLVFVASFANASEVANNAARALIRQGKLPEAEQKLQKALSQNPRDASAMTLLGEVKVRRRQYLQAEKLFQDAVRIDPKLVAAHSQLASLYTDEERIDEAISASETVHKLRPQDMKTRAELAALYERKGKHQKSIELAKSIPAATRPDRLLPVMISDYLGLNQPDEAQKLIGQILQKAPTNAELVPQLATIFLRQRMVNDAAQLLRIAEGHQKTTPSFLTALAKAQLSTGQSEQAKATIAKALELDPNYPDALLEQARQQGTAGDWSGAVATIKKILKLTPPRVSILQNLVFAALQGDDLQTAHDAALDLNDLTPASPDTALTLAVVLVRAARWGEAKPLLDQVLAARPDDKRAKLALGIVHYNLGNLDQAAPLLSASLGQGLADAEAHYMLGLAAKQRGDIPGAAREMELSLDVLPDKPEALASLGQLYLQLNETEKARDILERAVAKLPDNPQNHYQLALAYRKLNQIEKAREQMEVFQKLSERKVPQPTGETSNSPR
jgi:tetratricopeptide (TPR) repeat protein